MQKVVENEFGLGTIISAPARRAFRLTEEHLSAHACVLGQTRSGKSKFLELVMRYLTTYGKGGFALIDPHGDLAEDMLAFAAYRKIARREKDLLKRIHYLEPSYEQVFHYDPFKFRPQKSIPEESRKEAFAAWLHTKSDSVGKIVQRKQGDIDFQGMARLQRVLTDVLVAVGTAVDESGKHLPMADALVLLQLEHERHAEVFSSVAPHLDPEIRAEFERFHRYKNPYQYLHETESTINRLRSLLSPLVKSIFSRHVHTIDFTSIIQNGEILLVNLRETDYFSADQANAIGGLFIHELLTTARNTPREKRRQFTLIVDEASEFIGGDIDRALATMGKFKMSVVLAAQNLQSFVKGDLDLRPKVLSQCHTKVSFRQTWPDDVEILARVLGTGNLDFQKHYQIVDRPDDYDFVKMDEYSENWSEQDTWSNGFAVKEDEGSNWQKTDGVSEEQTWSKGRNWQQTESESKTKGESHGRSRSETKTESLHEHKIVGETRGVTEGEERTVSSSRTEGRSSSQGGSEGEGGSRGKSHSDAAGGSKSKGISLNETKGGGKSRGGSVSHKIVPLARTREERHESPNLLNSVPDQFERMKQQLHTLGSREAVALVRDEKEAFVFRTAEVEEAWLENDKPFVIEKMKEQLAAIHPYLSKPALGPEAQDRRIDEYLGAETAILRNGVPRAANPFDEEKTP